MGTARYESDVEDAFILWLKNGGFGLGTRKVIYISRQSSMPSGGRADVVVVSEKLEPDELGNKVFVVDIWEIKRDAVDLAAAMQAYEYSEHLETMYGDICCTHYVSSRINCGHRFIFNVGLVGFGVSDKSAFALSVLARGNCWILEYDLKEDGFHFDHWFGRETINKVTPISWHRLFTSIESTAHEPQEVR